MRTYILELNLQEDKHWNHIFNEDLYIGTKSSRRQTLEPYLKVRTYILELNLQEDTHWNHILMKTNIGTISSMRTCILELNLQEDKLWNHIFNEDIYIGTKSSRRQTLEPYLIFMMILH